jgi:MFS transporter, SET family, sugar efflux transporter
MPSALAAAGDTTASSAARSVWASPLYRGATAALFLSGLGTSAAAPRITLFLVSDLHVSLTTAGLFYLTNITAPLAGYLIGARSDRSGKRLGLFRWCALAGFLGWVAMALAGQAWMPFVISAVVLAFSGAAASQLFAAVHDDLEATASPVADGVVSIVRMALTAGWVVGPVLGSILAAAAGPRVMLAATGACALAQIAPLGFARTRPARPAIRTATASASEGQAEHAAGRPNVRTLLPLLAFTGLFVLVYAGEPIKYGYLPIYLRDGLHLPTAVSGAVIGIQPLAELILMPVAVVAARRTGMMRLMILGAGFGVAANLCFALTGDAAGMFAGQILMGGVWGVFAALGIIVAQRLLPQATATASAIFINSTAIASALGGLTGSLGVSLLGLPHVFFAPALYGLIATTGIAVMSRSSDLDRPDVADKRRRARVRPASGNWTRPAQIFQKKNP